MPEEKLIDNLVDNLKDENTGGIALTPRPKQPQSSPKTNRSEALPD